MKKIRDYEPTSIHDWCAQEKTTFLLDEEERTHFKQLLNDNKFDEFEREIRWELSLYDRHSRFDGDRYEIYWFYLTKKDNLTVVHEWGYSV